MATSGENVTTTRKQVTCTAPVVLLGFPVECNWSEVTDIALDTDGSAVWECPDCRATHTGHESDLP
jgi:Zn-finger protein